MIVEVLIVFQLGFKGKYRPSMDIVRDFYAYGHVVDSSFKSARNNNGVDFKNDSVAKLGRNTATLASGKEIPCDLLVCGTGYTGCV